MWCRLASRHSYTTAIPVTNKHLTLNGSFINQQSIIGLAWSPAVLPSQIIRLAHITANKSQGVLSNQNI